jgi:hypothetical protein
MTPLDQRRVARTLRELTAAVNRRDRHLGRRTFHARYIVAVLRAQARERSAA